MLEHDGIKRLCKCSQLEKIKKAQVKIMSEKPTYEKLEQRIQELEQAEFERKKAEKALRESEAKLLEAQSVANIGNWAWDLQTNKLSWSEENYRIFGLPLEVSPSYETFEKTIHPEDRAFVNKNVEDALKRKKPYNIEFRIILPDDKEGIVHAIGKVDYDKEDKPLRFFGTVQDITERKRSEKTLQRSEALLNATQQLTKVGGWEWDVEKQTMFWTDEVYRIHDFQPSEFTPGSTKHIERGIECYDPEDRPVILEAFKNCAEKGQAYDLEFLFTTATGRRIWIRTVADPVLKGDRVVRVVGNIMDITERKQTLEVFKEQKEFSEKIIKTSTAIIVGLDKNHKIRIFNKGAEKITGFKSNEVIGNDWFKIFFKPDIYDEMDKVWKDAWGVKFHSYVNPIRSKNGDEKIISWQTVGMYDGADETKHMLISIGEDITERKQAEEALRESEEKLARAKKMEALGLLAGGIAHDLNNVLSGIVSYPELLLLALPQNSKLREPIEAIQRSGHRAVAIVQDLLTVARGVATAKEPLNLNDIVSDYLNSPEFKKLEHFHPTVTVKTDLDAGLLNISGSHVHISKVVMNLVSNASEAVEGGGHVTISTVNRHIDKPLRGYDDVNVGEYVVLAVSDDGSGISSDDLERIFEPFYTKKVMGISGTGLGLAVVWNVVQDHKGYIDVTTDENGTTFELFFPVTRGKISGKDLAITIEDFKGDGETILVVDDVESQRDISCKMLDTLGYKTKAVSSGEEAVEYLKENTVDLLLLDMIMDPGINGRETYERIIEIHPNQKAIIISGFAETEDVKEAQKLGAGKYIKKPLTLERIGMAVKEELEKK